MSKIWPGSQSVVTLYCVVTCSESKREGKEQESIQSSTTPDAGNQWESDNFSIRHHKREPRGQPPPPAGYHKEPTNRRTRKYNKSKTETTGMIHKRSTALERSAKTPHWRARTGEISDDSVFTKTLWNRLKLQLQWTNASDETLKVDFMCTAKTVRDVHFKCTILYVRKCFVHAMSCLL